MLRLAVRHTAGAACVRRGRAGRGLLALVYGAALAGCLAAGCCGVPVPPGGGGEGPGRRPQRLALTPRQELVLGRQAYRQLLEEAGDRVLPADAPEVRRVRRVADRIIEASEIEPLQREINLRLRGYRFEWEVSVIRDRRANALCLPGGKIAVLTGILPVARTEGQLATVLSHEIAHALAHHASERVAREASGGLAILWNKRYDREQEAEADHIGVFLMAFAGYDPEEAVEFWERMQQAQGAGGRLPEILSDHPSDARRLRNLQQWVPAARAGKRAYDAGRIAPAPRR
jgi:predicted Zn-dependent protease